MNSAKTVLITGCSQGGIGDEIAQSFHRRGFRVFATARNLDKIKHLKGLGIDVLALDVTDPVSVIEAAASVQQITGGRLDFLVNNSGLAFNMPLLDADVTQAKTVFEVNVWAILRMVQAFASMLVPSKGIIINIGSTAGEVPIPYMGIYNSSKAAANILSDILRLEVEPMGVKVITVVAGGVRTNIEKNVSSSRELPKTSFYNTSKEAVEKAMTKPLGSVDQKEKWTAKQMAEAIVKNAVQRNPTTKQWTGHRSSLLWFFLSFFPMMLTIPPIFASMKGLPALKKVWDGESAEFLAKGQFTSRGASAHRNTDCALNAIAS